MGYADSDARKWVYHTQTEKKHKILKSYLDAWYPILGSWNRRLVVVDGFAGRARYTPRVGVPPNDVDKIEGSPLIMLKSLIDHDRFRDKGLDRLQFVFLFIELDDENHRLLNEEIDQYKASLPSWPTNVTVLVKPCRFDDVSKNGIEEYILNAQIGPNLVQATFLFVDPFGFTGFSMDLLAQICRKRDGHTVELFLNFMSDYVLRSVSEQCQGRNLSQEQHMTKLFGVDIEEWRTYRAKNEQNAEELIALFTNQLQKHAQFKHILSLAMRRQDKSTIYYLVYATRHLRGVEAMKNAMWKCDPDAAEALCARAEPLEAQLLRYFQTKLPVESFGIGEIEEFILADTPFRKSAGTMMLKKLEDNGNIALDEGGRSGKGYLKDSKFSFKGEGNMNGGTKRKQIRRTNQSGSPSKKQTTITSFFKPQKA